MVRMLIGDCVLARPVPQRVIRGAAEDRA